MLLSTHFHPVDINDFFIGATFLTIPPSTSSPNSRRSCVQYFVLQDGISEEVESFTFVLDSQQQVVIIDPPITEVFILDDDGRLMKWTVCNSQNLNNTHHANTNQLP